MKISSILKSTVVAIALICGSVVLNTQSTYAQSSKTLHATVTASEGSDITAPSYKDGPEALVSFITTEVKYPESAKKAKLEGKVVVSFVIDENGNVTNTKVVNSVNKLLDAEALRVVNAMPAWNAGSENGKPVATELKMPIVFALPK